jgi:UDP-4-amino-4,6-dideoxy-N-acetyl-beta-L-altrosamine transaminase
MIPYGRQHITEDDIASVVEVLRSDFLTQGQTVPAFESAVAAYTGAKHAIAANSATSCLHMACMALDVGPGDMVWTAPNSFVASANCALYCGADVDFVDIDPDSFCMSADALAAKLAATNTPPKVVIPVHFSGHSCDMKRIHALSKQYGFRIIEDASHCIGARYDGKKIGSCAYADIAVFSFHPVKIITTGEGGMCMTNDDGLAVALSRLRSHGITRDTEHMRGASDGPWYYQQIALGYNYRITDIQCALGLSQMTKLDAFIAKRRALAGRYHALFQASGLPIRLPTGQSLEDSSWHLYVVRFPEAAGVTRRAAFEALREAGIGVNVHYIPIHVQPFYKARGFKQGDFPNAETYYSEAISIPLYPDITHEQQDYIVATIKALYDQ